MSEIEQLKVALVHDELTRRGGAEIVLEELAMIFPQADIYALYAGRPMMSINGRKRSVHTSFLQHWPLWWRRHPKRVLPLLPYAAEQLDLSGYDVVISSASGFVKGIITRADIPHVCYCHTPTRYLWEDAGAATRRAPVWQRWPGRILQHYLRLADFAAAQRVDYFIANSRWTKQRINTYYRREAKVIYPPIDTSFFTPAYESVSGRRKKYFLCVGRLTPSKNFDQAIAVGEKLRLPLVIAGSGYDERRLRKLAGPYTTFAGRVDREELRDLYRNARALLQPGAEDFGMAAAEAAACGTPVVAYGVGGIREIAGKQTAQLYAQPTVEALAEAIRKFIVRENK
ncbi:MAG: glycosyltransferase, partial [Candidatus Andersenbacteria bacterium]|nr:glycosyltransferase [Candidatus Andersenbacteria bacterium]